jgi:hypothetical protein
VPGQGLYAPLSPQASAPVRSPLSEYESFDDPEPGASGSTKSGRRHGGHSGRSRKPKQTKS